MFYSTRNAKLSLKASDVILKGISDDGGLFLPEQIKPLDYQGLLDASYQEIACAVLDLYLDDYSKDEIKDCVDKAYSSKNFPEKICNVSTFGSYSFLELFHGQTLTFKDMALSLLPHLMEKALAKHPEEKEIHILTATSGDTGSAVLSSFASCPSIKVSVLYPDDGISFIQEKQMLSFSSNNERAYALKNSNFDDCQTLVKQLLLKRPEGQNFSSANSINIGRLLPQIIYYYESYISLVKKGTIKDSEKLDVVVPTGNFGDIFAAYLAKKMGLPLGRLVVASNANRVLTDFFATGVYDANRHFTKTNSPSMDILVSSNLERLLYLSSGSDETVKKLEASLAKEGRFAVDKKVLAQLQADFVGFSADEEMTKKAIKKCYAENHYVLDPHTAVAYACYEQYAKAASKHCLIVATASPLKFPRTIVESLGLEKRNEAQSLDEVLSTTGLILPPQLKSALATEAPKMVVSAKEFEKRLSSHLALSIETPASSANLGPGFDVCGIALNLKNHFTFEKAAKDSLDGFEGEEETKDNLVRKAYRYYFEQSGKPYVPCLIKLDHQGIPLSRGLGSSASCIVAGLLAANEFSGHSLSKETLLRYAVALEGHPDNVAPCLFGGFVASFKNSKGEITHRSYFVNKNLGFLLVIPNHELATSLARSVLPKSYPLADLTYDCAHLIHLPEAFKEADLPLLKEIIGDKVHVPYRLPLIAEGQAVEAVAEKHNLPFTISGAGSSMLILYSLKDEAIINETIKDLQEKVGSTCEIKPLRFDEDGAMLEVK